MRKTTRKVKRSTGPPKALTTFTPFFDTDTTISVNNSAVQYSLLYNLCAANGLLQAFPQHASPYVSGSVNGLRQRIYLRRLEFRYRVVGCQSSTLAAGDIYNTMRVAVVRTGFNYSAVNPLYLNSVVIGSNLNTVQHVYFDKTFDLPSLAFSTGNYNSPSVVTGLATYNINRYLTVYSGNATGSGVAWDTDSQDYVINCVSDSTLTPHPTLEYSARFFFEYVTR
jgi:hypothetical protein